MNENIKNKKTRVVCTIGPSTDDEDILRKLVENGMNVARLNTSHDTMSQHEKRVETLVKIRKEMNIPLAILLDLEGPKIRTGNFETDEVSLVEGQIFILTSQEIIGNNERVSINYKELPKDVKKGDVILIDDGKIKLEVIKTDGKEITTNVIVGGIITHHRGINVPGVDINLPPLTQKDKEFLTKAVDWNIEYVAQSFVRKPDDIIKTKRILTEIGIPDLPVIAKIETLQ